MNNFFQQSPVAGSILLMVITFSLIAFNRSSVFFEKLILHPWGLVRGQRPYSLILHAFIHADFFHLIFNMITFYFFAFNLELFVGHINFAIIYFGSLFVSVIPTIVKYRNDFDYRSLGASGAVSGIIFSAILYQPTSKIYLFLIPIGIPAPIFALLFVAYSYYASKEKYDNIAHEAHLWGAIGGTILTLILDPGVFPRFLDKIF